MGKSQIFSVQLATGALASLFCYAALSKLLHYQQSENEMLNQIFPRPWALVFTWLIPSLELLLVIGLLWKTTQRVAMWAATLLLLLFSLYIALVMSGVFGRVPCSCGGILKNMSYGMHLVFNLLFMIVGIYGIASAGKGELTNVAHFKKGGE